MKNDRIPLHLGERSYDILIADDRYRNLGSHLKRLRIGTKALVVTNPAVYRKHAKDFTQSLRQARITPFFAKNFPTNEKAKSLASLTKLIDLLVKSRADFVICFGGGVLGDLTGFGASVYKRGIPYIQVPTTFLAQVDSAIGGKTAVDLPEGKNLLGAFYQPRLVYSELSVLRELPDENIQDGLAEAIKCGMIYSESFFRFIETHAEKLLKKDTKSLRTVVRSCSQIKASIVKQDEYDKKGKRIILNYGHTLGHALEQVAGYHTRHGRAISVGMLMAADISEALGLFGTREVERLENLLKRVRLPITLLELNRRHWNIDRILEAEGRDKKFVHGKNRYVLPIRIGKVIVREGIPYSLIRKVISKRLGG